MTEAYLFEPGQKVTITARAWGSKEARGAYKVVRQLPPDARGNLYRIRSELEQHDRVVTEAQLSRAAE
jgi:hypothetical protein